MSNKWADGHLLEYCAQCGKETERPRFPSRSVVFIVIERLSFPCVNRGSGLAARVKSFRISTQFLNFHSNVA
jgi:hypothetical protein